VHLGFVMRENIVYAAAVNIDLFAKLPGCHRAAFDMPAGAAALHGLFPADVAVFFIPLSKRKIPMCSLSYRRASPGRSVELREIEMSGFRNHRKFVDAEIN
jgi:hypothetical protein